MEGPHRNRMIADACIRVSLLLAGHGIVSNIPRLECSAGCDIIGAGMSESECPHAQRATANGVMSTSSAGYGHLAGPPLIMIIGCIAIIKNGYTMKIPDPCVTVRLPSGFNSSVAGAVAAAPSAKYTRDMSICDHSCMRSTTRANHSHSEQPPLNADSPSAHTIDPRITVMRIPISEMGGSDGLDQSLDTGNPDAPTIDALRVADGPNIGGMKCSAAGVDYYPKRSPLNVDNPDVRKVGPQIAGIKQIPNPEIENPDPINVLTDGVPRSVGKPMTPLAMDLMTTACTLGRCPIDGAMSVHSIAQWTMGIVIRSAQMVCFAAFENPQHPIPLLRLRYGTT